MVVNHYILELYSENLLTSGLHIAMETIISLGFYTQNEALYVKLLQITIFTTQNKNSQENCEKMKIFFLKNYSTY